MSAVGIDFGNESCVVAVVRRGAVEVILNDLSNRKTPSAVAFAGEQRLIGEATSSQQMSNFKNTITSVKRLIGQTWNSQEVQEMKDLLLYNIREGPHNSVQIEVQYGQKSRWVTPEQVVAALFVRLKSFAEKALDGVRVSECVISCPPSFTDYERRALIHAASVAGLNVVRLMSDTTAVCLNYGILRPLPENTANKVLFFDLGHLSTDVCVASFQKGKLQVQSVYSHRSLGGMHFTNALVKHFADFVNKKYKIDVYKNKKSLLRLEKACDRLKLVLSANTEGQLSVECLQNDIDVHANMKREEFIQLVQPLLDQVLIPVKKALEAAKIDVKDLFAVELIGGGSRVPAVKELLQNFFGKEKLSTTCNADEAISLGCALQAAILSPSIRVRDFLVNDASPYPIELAFGPMANPDPAHSANNHVEPEGVELIFPRFSNFPVSKMITFYKSSSFMLTLRYAPCEELPAHAPNPIARYIVSGIQTDLCEKPKVKVTVTMDIHGLVSVTKAQQVDALPAEDEKKAAEAKPADAKDKKEKDDSTMEVDEPAPAAADAKPAAAAPAPAAEKKKTKYRHIDLKITGTTVPLFAKEQLDKDTEEEAKMSLQDRIIRETAEKRNELESYVYEMRSKIRGDLAAYIKPEDADAFASKLDATEDWLYTDEAHHSQKSAFAQRIADLHKIGDPVVRRHLEHQLRPEAADHLKAVIVQNQMDAASTDKKYEHIGAEERAKVTKECQEADQWLSNIIAKQNALSLFDEPAVTVVELRNKAEHVDRVCKPIMNKPKPAPAPAPAPASAAASSSSTSSDSSKAAPSPAPEAPMAEPSPAKNPSPAKASPAPKNPSPAKPAPKDGHDMDVD